MEGRWTPENEKYCKLVRLLVSTGQTLGVKGSGRGHILFDFIYMKCPERQLHKDGKQVSGCQGLGKERQEVAAYWV